MDKDSEVTSDKYTDYLEADLKKAGTYVKYSLISGYHNLGMFFAFTSEGRKKHVEKYDKTNVDLRNNLKAIDKKLEEALDKEKNAKELLPKVYMVLSKIKNPNARKAFEAYFNYLKRQSDTDDTFLYNVSKGTGIGLAEGATGYYAAEVVGGTTFSLLGISMLFRGDTRIEVPKENEQNTYIPMENRITIASSEALKFKKFFIDYYKDRMGYYNVLESVKNEGIPRNTSTLENDPRISEDIAGYYNGERSKLENKGYVVGNIVGNIAGYKLASKGAFYKNNSTYTSVQNEVVEEFNNSKLYSVVPEMAEIDMERGTLINNSYIKNPSAKDITTYVNNSNYLGTGGKKGALNGEYMYIIDSEDNIIIGTRTRGFTENGKGFPHPTLVGGKNPQVQGAGIIEIRGGKIYRIDNASGHFQPGAESLKRTEKIFHDKIPNKYFSNDFEGFKIYDSK
jgi:hemolysin